MLSVLLFAGLVIMFLYLNNKIDKAEENKEHSATVVKKESAPVKETSTAVELVKNNEVSTGDLWNRLYGRK